MTTTNTASNHDFMTVQQTASYLQVSSRTVLRWIKSGKLAASSPPNTRIIRIQKQDVFACMKSSQQQEAVPCAE